ncbi:MAG: hypothetical protein AYK18_15910 [Theionarchaea archaeon DG-70]|nr:MAG: hypothetical protein AYK18_15910 [Theionarchaea archaeon DG-70]
MVSLLRRRELEKEFEKEIAPKIRKLEIDHGDSILANELRRIKAQMNYRSAETIEKTLEILDQKASQALEVYENEYVRIYKPVIEGLADDGKIEEVLNLFDNEEKLTVAIRLYSRIPLQKINILREQIRSKGRTSERYIKLIRQNATANCPILQDILNWFLMEYENLLDEPEKTRSETMKHGFLTLGKTLTWITNLVKTQKTLEEKARALDENNKNLLDFLIFAQRYLSEDRVNMLTERISGLDIIKPGLASQQIEEFLPNLFLSGNMTDRERRFCQRMKNSLARCIYERISKIYPI